MSESGVIPRPEDRAKCRLCGDTGWLTYAGKDDEAWDIPCPQGCPVPGWDGDVPP